MIHGTHDALLVIVSIVIAIFASYTALDLAHRISVARGLARSFWLAGGSGVMGLGIWSMHFVAMLSFSIPGLPIAYDVPLLILSLLVAVGASSLALFVVSRRELPVRRMVSAGLAMGAAISGMHYIGIAGMRMSAAVHWDLRLVGASIAIALGASFAALWLAFRWREQYGARTVAIRLMAGTVMGFAISGMHYTAMAAMRFTPDANRLPIRNEDVLATDGLAISVALASAAILCMAIIASTVQRELDRRWKMVDELERLVRDSRRRAEEEEALRRATESVASAISVDEVLDQIAREAIAAIRAETALVERFDSVRTEIVVASASGRLTSMIGACFPYAGSFSERITGHHEPLVIDDVVRPSWCSEGEGEGPCSALAVPLSVDGVDVGTLVLLRGKGQPSFGADETARASIFGHLSALAFRRIHLLEEADRRREELEHAERLAGLGRLASSIAHEFNNILMSIQAFNEVTRRVGTYEQYVNAAPQVDRAVQRGKSITNAVLGLTRASRPEQKVVHVSEWLDTLGADLRSLLPETIQVQTDCADTSLFIWADVSHLEQVFVNLALNARDAMPLGGTFSIAASESDEDPSEFVSLVVADTGTGMSREVQSRAFEPLYTTRKGGTGLGLAITREMVRAHGGSLTLESTEGEGTIFRILLRRAPAPAPALRSVAAVVTEIHRARRILLVEDDDAVAEGLAMILELDGHEVRRIALGGETVEAMREFEPEVIVLDVGLPDMDGYSVYQHIAHHSPGMPVVFATGHADPRGLEQIANCENVVLLRKPFDGVALGQALDSVIRSGTERNLH